MATEIEADHSSHNTSRAAAIAHFMLSVVVCFGAAAIGAQFMPGEWYESLNKPSWNPPNWIFGPIWTVLYLMMAVSAWLVWRERGWQDARGALMIFGVQLVLNACWSWLFFGRYRPDLALVDIVLLWLAIGVTIRAFWPINRIAAYLLVPYWLWVSFATALNFTLWRLN